MQKGLSHSTLRSYEYAWKSFALFCFSLRIPLYPILISTICAFICHCKDVKNHKISVIRSTLAGVQFVARCSNPDMSSFFSNPSIKLLLKGIAKSSPPGKDSRKPITLSILHSMINVLRKGKFGLYHDALLETVFLLAFYGFLRSGEFTCNSAFDPDSDICFSDLTFHPQFYNLFLKSTKAQKGCSIIVARVDSSFCPYRGMLSYLKLRKCPSPLSPLFLISANSPLTKSWFISHMKNVLADIGLDPEHYSGHSFRIGAATTAATQGISSASLQQLGRWSSAAYATYIRPNHEAILTAQKSFKP